MDQQCLATVQRMLTETKSARCIARASAVLRLSDGSPGDFRVSSMPGSEHRSFDSALDRWLQIKWNTIIAPLVRDFSLSKCAPSKSKSSNSSESVAGTALYVLLHRAVSRDCPLTGQGRITSGNARWTSPSSLNRTRSIPVEFRWKPFRRCQWGFDLVKFFGSIQSKRHSPTLQLRPGPR